MTLSRASIRSLRRTPFARTVVEAWRRLTDGAEATTLAACSGGADSVALLLALTSAEPERIAVAHVRHDMRPATESAADEAYVRELARRLDLPCVSRSVKGADTEEAARTLRYGALSDTARGSGGAFVATGHHADDQLETFLMRAIRGSGPSGLRGIAPIRELAEGVRLVRPMLAVTHADAEDFCREAGVAWREDATNRDTDRTRAAVRATILPALRKIRPDAAERVSETARLQRGAHEVIAERVRSLGPDESRWAREILRREHELVVGELLREAYRRRTAMGHDRLTLALVTPVVRAIGDASTEPREFDWPGGARVRVTAHEAEFIAAGA